MNSKAVGERTEGIILGYLIKKGYTVLVPFGDNQRYDLVVDAGNGKFIRGQCKTGRYRNGCVEFSTSSHNPFTNEKTSYHGQIEVFWVYCEELETFYEVQVEETSKNSKKLRVEHPKNNATKTVK